MKFYSELTKKLYETQEEVIAAELAVKEAEAKKADATKKKKADAEKVEVAFKALNAARKTYRENTAALTKKYSEEIAALKKAFAEQREKEEATLAKAETAYSAALKEFTDKYETYHLSLKDGDFETTISSDRKSATSFDSIASLFDWLFR
jgi:predicted  nucleic acid-binding Zn-ribbon protein